VRRAADSANDLQKLPKRYSSGQRVLLTLWREISNTLKTLVLDCGRFAINAGADGCDLLSSFLEVSELLRIRSFASSAVAKEVCWFFNRQPVARGAVVQAGLAWGNKASLSGGAQPVHRTAKATPSKVRRR
jgi:hypothetical protein